MPLTRLACLVLVVCPLPLSAAEPFRYPEARHGKGELKYQNDLPVITLRGSPEETGAQIGQLGKPAQQLLNYPKDCLKHWGFASTWPALVSAGKGMLPQFHADHRRELEAAIKSSGMDEELCIAANTMFDIKKLFACSALIVEPSRSATGGMLMGRNLDFATLGYLHEYSAVIIYHPEGKHSFVSIGFPGVVGVLSGMNDAGLALAVLEVADAKDDSPRFDPRGTPYALCFRRILEECRTVTEAEKLLQAMQRTTRLNLAICDTQRGVVFELTPKQVVVRPASDGLCPCTNHFRTPELATNTTCRRYDVLEQSRKFSKLTVADVKDRMHQAHQVTTLQCMVFEPSALKLHLAIGATPASALPLKTLDLKPLLEKP